MTSHQRILAALGGLLAAAAGLGLGELTAALAGGTSPVVGVGTQLIDLAPGPAKDWAVKNLGTADKPILVGGVLVAVAVFALVAGAVGVKRPRVALGMTVLLGLLAILAAATGRSLATNAVVRVLPGVITLLVATAGMYLVLRARGYSLRRKSPTSAQPEIEPGTENKAGTGIKSEAGTELKPDAGTGINPEAGTESKPEAEAPDGFDRRKFLVTTFALGAVGAAGGVVSRVLPGGVDEATRRGIRLPVPASRAKALPAGVAADAAGVSPFTTPNKSFYRVDTLLTVPKVDPRNWELRIHGMVDKEIRLNFADLLNRKLIERDITLTCVSNEVGGPYVGNARWIGVPIAEILREAGVQDGADAVKSTSVDGLTIGTPLAALTDGRDAIFAIGMNGEPLPFDHGFPVRMVVPGLYGYVSATKWIVDFEVTRFDDFSAYWTDRGWSVEAPIKTSSRIDVPKGFARVKPGPAVAAGVAWAQHRGIEKVEVQVDDGPWQEAKLADEAGIDIWRQWTFRWDATSGNHTLTVRATDKTGQVQTSDRAAPRPNGSSGLHNTVVMVE
ncbi:molybdopterin-dependent oxidoreductase [Kribbella italica]|uniref:DMSO/TMAO reductase YedYZ molybdopterin-dependent catalytic subunit n=1 Tax=Kribbella italica TaxID=1540520 RepID=A0A7W9MXN1_9ACTN|nr:molybdopterin-dependent oxidoreductase [Kribbella italica]MBB5840316.1 DMSO/TMAO reductase YedYZ molybdopterin-dependent catalytic subunit [Kribbella italica]